MSNINSILLHGNSEWNVEICCSPLCENAPDLGQRLFIRREGEIVRAQGKNSDRNPDWTKSRTIEGTRVCIGVQSHFSRQSDLLILNILHLTRAVRSGHVDVGILITPKEFLSLAKRHLEEANVQHLPLVLLGMRRHGPRGAVSKQAKKDPKSRVRVADTKLP